MYVVLFFCFAVLHSDFMLFAGILFNNTMVAIILQNIRQLASYIRCFARLFYSVITKVYTGHARKVANVYLRRCYPLVTDAAYYGR